MTNPSFNTRIDLASRVFYDCRQQAVERGLPAEEPDVSGRRHLSASLGEICDLP